MREEVTLRYSESLVHDAIFAFWRRTIGWGFPIALLICAIGLIAMLMKGNRTWLVGVVGSVLVLGIGFCALLYFSHYRSSMAKFRALKDSNAVLKVEPESITLSSSEGSSTMRWDAVSEIWKFEKFWLLLFSKAQFVTLPVEPLTPEMRHFISGRVSESGGKVDA